MKKERTDIENRFSELRKKASGRTPPQVAVPENLDRDEILRLYSELQIYHEELLLQNDELRQTADELEKARFNFYNLFKLNPLPMVILDLNAKIKEYNFAFGGLTGRSNQKILNQPFYKFIVPDDQPTFISQLRSLMSNPSDLQLEVRIESASKDIHLARLKADFIHWQPADPNGEAKERLMLTLVDITSERKAEEVLARDRRRLQILFDLLKTSLLDETEVIPTALTSAMELTQSQAALWFELDAAQTVLRLKTAAQMEDGVVRLGYPQISLPNQEDYAVLWKAFLEIKNTLADDLDIQLEDRERSFYVRIRNLLAMPIQNDGQVSGVMALINKERPYAVEDILEARLLLNLTQHILLKQALEKEILNQREQFQDFLNSSNDLLYRVRLFPNPKVDFISPSVERITGYSSEELFEKPERMMNLIHPEDLSLLQKLLTDPSQLPTPLIGRFLHRSGEVRFAEQKITPIYDDRHDLIGFQGVVRDITERIERENQVKRLLKDYDVLFNSSEETFFLIKVEENGEFRYLRNNQAHQRLTGFSTEDIQGKTPVELLGEELGRQIAANYQRCAEAGQTISYEETLDLPGGLRTWLTTLTPVFENNRLEYIIGAAQDISKIREYEEKIKQSETRYQKLFSQIQEGFCIWRTLRNSAGFAVDFTIEEINPAGLKLIGLPLEKTIHIRLSEIQWRIEPPIEDLFHKIEQDGRPLRAEIFIHEIRQYWQISLQKIDHDLIAESFLDITQKKLIELERERIFRELQAKNHELENFTYTVSHDLKSPLITIRTFSDFVEEDLAENRIQDAVEDLKRVQNAAVKIQNMLDGLLELSRLGRKLNLLGPVKIADAVQEAIQNLEGKIESFDRPIRFNLPEQFPTIMGDHLRLVQLFQNLVDNAIKYMGEQPAPEIEIGWSDTGKEVEFYVRDNGNGIEPENLTRIFELFVKPRQDTPGYGIGLSVAQRIVEMHGGKIWAESEGIGKGSVFRFTFPYLPQKFE